MVDDITAAKAVGSKGSNVRLCQRLTDYRINVRTVSNSDNGQINGSLYSPEDQLYAILGEVISEIHSGQIEVVDAVREPGIQSTVIVRSIDGRSAIHRCLGENKSNISTLTERLDEQIWFVNWSSEPEELLIRCLGISYRYLDSVEIQPNTDTATVIVRNRRTAAMAIGENGMRVKQTAQLLKLRRIYVRSSEPERSDES